MVAWGFASLSFWYLRFFCAGFCFGLLLVCWCLFCRAQLCRCTLLRTCHSVSLESYCRHLCLVFIGARAHLLYTVFFAHSDVRRQFVSCGLWSFAALFDSSREDRHNCYMSVIMELVPTWYVLSSVQYPRPLYRTSFWPQ